MAATYEPIATQTVSSSTTSITFSSIPQTYTDLRVIINGTSNAGGAAALAFRFNSDSGGNYSYRLLYGTGSSAAGNYGSNTTEGYFGNVWTTPAISRADIMDYTSSSKYKTAISRTDDAANRTAEWITTWRNTSAVTTLQITTSSSYTYEPGTTFTIYGIKAA